MLASETHAHDQRARHPRHGRGAASGRRGVRRQPATERLGMRRSVMRRLVLETTAPFQGLPELVAYYEGLFEREGLVVEWVDREAGVEKKDRKSTRLNSSHQIISY